MPCAVTTFVPQPSHQIVLNFSNSFECCWKGRAEGGGCCVSLQGKKVFPCQPGLLKLVKHISITYLLEGFDSTSRASSVWGTKRQKGKYTKRKAENAALNNK